MKMKHWLIWPVFFITLSIIVKLVDCYELTRDILFHEEDLRSKIDIVENDMDLTTNLTILKNMADLNTTSLLDQRIHLAYPRYLFNKTRNDIMSAVKSLEQSTELLFSKFATTKDNILKSLDENFKNAKADVKKAVESMADKPVRVIECVKGQKSVFDSLVEESITKAMHCVKDTVEEGMKAINEALDVSTEAKVLVEDLSKQEAECENESAENDGILKCLLGILRSTKTSVQLVFVKIKTVVLAAFKTSKEALPKLIGCQPTIKMDTLKIILNIEKCAENKIHYWEDIQGEEIHGDGEV